MTHVISMGDLRTVRCDRAPMFVGGGGRHRRGPVPAGAPGPGCADIACSGCGGVLDSGARVSAEFPVEEWSRGRCQAALAVMGGRSDVVRYGADRKSTRLNSSH